MRQLTILTALAFACVTTVAVAQVQPSGKTPSHHKVVPATHAVAVLVPRAKQPCLPNRAFMSKSR
jgi:hypothetical protein